MSLCDRCDRPAGKLHSVILFHDDGNFTAWTLSLCQKCFGNLPREISLILGKEPDK